MAFNFNKPASTGAPSGGLFGTAGSAPGGNLFGTNTGGSSTGFSFGAPPASTAGEQKSLFGTAAGGFKLPSKPADNNSEPPKSLFGTSQTPATPGSSAPSLFGTTTPAGGQTFSFGNPSTTPAGPPPSQSTFGASTGASNIFGTGAATSTNAPTSKPSFSFGQSAANTSASASSSTPATSAPSLFGNASSGGGLFASGTTPASGGMFSTKQPEKPADATPKSVSATTEPAKSAFSFGTTPSNAPPTTSASSLFSATPAATASGGSLFAKLATEAANKPTFSFPTASAPAPSTSASASSAAPPKSLFGGPGGATSASSNTPLFGPPASATTPASSSAPTTTAQASAPSSGGSLFSGFGTNTSTPATRPATTVPAFAFNNPAPTAGSQASATTPTSSAAPTFTTTPATTTQATGASATAPTSSPFNANLGASTSGPTPPAQSRLKNKTMDEILTRWATDLTRYSKEFKTHAETIAHWDQIIVDNSQKIDKLYIKTRTCEKQTMSVEMQLSAVENQQNELESWLAKYENDVEEMLAKDGANLSEHGGPDQERERAYKLAEKLGERLDGMGKDLESMVEEVNTANASLGKYTKSDEPITQIVRILNSHLTQLQVIDQGTAQLQAKVTAAQRATNGMGYLNGSASGDARAVVDDFYRSYMGRR